MRARKPGPEKLIHKFHRVRWQGAKNDDNDTDIDLKPRYRVGIRDADRRGDRRLFR